MRWLPFVTWISFAPVLLGQQLTVTADRQQILIGDHLTLHAHVRAGQSRVERIDWKAIDTSSHFEMIEPGTLRKEENGQAWLQELVVTSFDSGTFYLPSIRAIIDQNGKEVSLMSNPIPIQVSTVLPDSLGLSPIKDIIAERVTWKDYLWVGWILLGLIALGVLLWWWRRRQRDQGGIQDIEVYVPPHERALEALDILEGEKLWQQGQTKEYEVRISNIFRRYIEEKLGFPALEWTRGEIMQKMSFLSLKDLSLPLVEEVLYHSDMVKYAKAQPGIESHQSQMDKVRAWILQTKDLTLEEE